MRRFRIYFYSNSRIRSCTYMDYLRIADESGIFCCQLFPHLYSLYTNRGTYVSAGCERNGGDGACERQARASSQRSPEDREGRQTGEPCTSSSTACQAHRQYQQQHTRLHHPHPRRALQHPQVPGKHAALPRVLNMGFYVAYTIWDHGTFHDLRSLSIILSVMEREGRNKI